MHAALLSTILILCAQVDGSSSRVISSNEPPKESTIPITVSAVVEPVTPPNGTLPLVVTISNGTLPNGNWGEVGHLTFSLTPNEWHGETAHVSLLDIYRDGVQLELTRARPTIKEPRLISGMGGHRIAPGTTLTVRTDATKWRIADGWKPGSYEAKVLVERLSVDGGRCFVTVVSEPFRFEVPGSAAPVIVDRPAPSNVDAEAAIRDLSPIDRLRKDLRAGTPIEKEAALDLIRELQAMRLVPEIIQLIDDPTPLPRHGDTGWGFVGHQAASIMSEFAIAIDRAGMRQRATSSYSFHDDQYKGGEALRAAGRLKEVRANWERWWQKRRSAE